ncbi:MAG TPA: DUF2934 domain-containing protein [Terriglobales bacterium]|jgi:hypothetical protein
MPRAKSPRNGDASARKITPITQGITQENKKASAAVNLQDEIRRRAYELYEARGAMPGYEHEDWVHAEREIMARHNQQSA